MANDRGVTPVGQAIMSQNIEALDLLLKHGADIHKNSINDLSISSKLMKPLHYIAKMVRLIGVSEEVQLIIEVFNKHEVKITDQDEKIGV